MRNKLLVIAALLPLIFITPNTEASSNYEVRRLKNGTCDVSKVSPGPEAGDRVAGPFDSKERAKKELRELKSTPRCKRF
jgi:hypothetical protein